MEGKEVRFGIGGSVLAAVTTSNGATGSYNSMNDSYTPIGGLVTILNMLFGEVVFGGLGTGLYSLVLIALVGLFVAGLMIGRTPEYLGKQVTATRELPRQVDTSRVDSTRTSGLGRNVSGGTWPRLSWGRSVL